jgi:pimeloyl-ACP methyl ester carboxylesterase
MAALSLPDGTRGGSLEKGLAAVVAASLFFLATVVPSAASAAEAPAFLDDTRLRARWAAAPSRFVTVDGVPIHLRDEGSGPALLLLNGHLGSLHMWDDWVPELTRHFRVIRIDYAPYGLSGPDPSGDYSTRRSVELVGKLADQLGLQRFHVGGTSNGALVALFYAIEHPERVDRVVVSTLPAGRPPRRTPSPAMVAAMAELRRTAPFQPRAFWQAFLEDITANDAVVTPALVDRYFELNNRAGAKAWVDAYIQTQYRLWDTLDVKAHYARLSRPILLQWGGDGVVLPEAIGGDVAALFTQAPVTLKVYRGAGHLPMIEVPRESVGDAIDFLRQ